MVFDKTKLIELLNYKEFIEEEFKVTLRDYNLKKYFELQNYLNYIKDFIIWKNSFSKYFKLFTDFRL